MPRPNSAGATSRSSSCSGCNYRIGGIIYGKRRARMKTRRLPVFLLFAEAGIRVMTLGRRREIRMEFFLFLCGDINLRNGKLLSFYHYPVNLNLMRRTNTTCPPVRIGGSNTGSRSSSVTACRPWQRRPSGNFTWLCLFDAATPESCRRRIEGYKARCPQFEAVYYTAAQAANLTENLRTTVAAYVSCDRKGRKSPPRSC